MNQHDFNAEAVEQSYVVNNIVEVSVTQTFTANSNNEGFSSVHIDIGGAVAKKLYIVVHSGFPFD
jgi:hypothetical protein